MRRQRAGKPPGRSRPWNPCPCRRPVGIANCRSASHWSRIIFVAYWGVWNYDFVYFDDPGYVTDNLNVVRGLPLFTDFKVFWASVHWAFTAFEQSNWHPLTWLSHMLDVQLYGLNAGGHHVTNIILHVCNTLLLFWLLRLTDRPKLVQRRRGGPVCRTSHARRVGGVGRRTQGRVEHVSGALTLLAYVRYSRKADLAGDSLAVLGTLSGFTWLLTLLCLGQLPQRSSRRFPRLAPVDLPADFRRGGLLCGDQRSLQPVAILPDLRAVRGWACWPSRCW